MVGWGLGDLVMESNQLYYRRRAIEERMAAQRAITQTAREWHAKLAADFAARANIPAPAVMPMALSA